MKGKTVLLLTAALVISGILFGPALLSQQLELTVYQVTSSKIPPDQTIRVALLADLHNRQYGKDNGELVAQIAEQAPDLIVMAGDMFTKGDEDHETVPSLCRQLLQIAPVCFGLGNHEGTILYVENTRVDELLEEAGVHVLINTDVELTIRGVPLRIGSISTNEVDYDLYSAEFVSEFEKSDAFKLMIAHYPSVYYDRMAGADIDLNLCGHYHGGILQIPGLGGLFSLEHGLFPKYGSGMDSLEKGTIIVSRGLGDHRNIPRINNRPELVMIDIYSPETHVYRENKE